MLWENCDVKATFLLVLMLCLWGCSTFMLAGQTHTNTTVSNQEGPTYEDAYSLIAVLLLLELLHQDGLLLVFAALVLEPHADHPRAQARHLYQLLLHQRVRPRVGVVARPQRVQLLLVQHRPHPRRLFRLLVDVVPVRGLPHCHRLCTSKGGRTNLVRERFTDF